MPKDGKGVFEGRTLADIVEPEPEPEKEEATPDDDEQDVEAPDLDTQEQTVTPDKLEGKTADELRKILKKRDSVVGRQGNELDTLRREVEDLRTRQTHTEGALQVSPDQIPEEELVEDPLADSDDEDYITIKEAKDLFSKVLEQDRKALLTSTRDKLIDAAGAAHLEGKQTLVNIPVSKGIEKETEAVVVAYFKPRIAAGYDVSNYIRDPKVWKKAAEYVRFQRGEFNMLSKETTDGISQTEPVPPFSGETPSGRKQTVPTKKQKELDAKGKYIVDEFDLTEDEVAAVQGA